MPGLSVIFLVCDFVGAAGVVWVLNWFSLRPFRRANTLHWAERARVLYPARAAARISIWAIPVDIALAQSLLWPEQAPHIALCILVGLVGAIVGSYSFDRETLPWLQPREWLRYVAVNGTIQFGIWLIFLACITAMPNELGWRTLVIPLLFVLLYLAWCRGGMIMACRKLGLLSPAPQRLQRIVADTAARVNVNVRGTWLMRSPASMAFALPYTGDLLFTERLLERHPDEEISAICAHELGHLKESKAVITWRVMSNLAWLLPWIFVKPLVHAFDPPFVGVLVLGSLIVRLASTRINRRLERRADRVAHEHELQPGTYARALARLYEDNLVPAVMPKRPMTHPDLYDRLLAVGVQPEFLRPKPPVYNTAAGVVMTALLGVLVAFKFMR